MRRNPIYVFEDLGSVGIYSVPLGSTIQINDADDMTPGSQPLLVQLIAKDGLNSGSLIADFLAVPTNYTNASDTTEIHSELEKINQNTKDGWRLLGAVPARHVEIGESAVDLTITTATGPEVYGAGGDYSFTAGKETKAVGMNSNALGLGTLATTASGTALGKYNVGTAVDTLLEVGVGISRSSRANGLEVYADGSATLPQATIPAIDAKGAQAIPTKEYVDNVDSLKVDRAGDTITGDVTIDGANLTVLKDGTGNLGSISSEGDINLGSESKIAFNSTSTVQGGQNFYFDNTAQEFKLDTVANEGYTVWHSGNQGTGSTLDADLLDGLQPLELPISTLAQGALDLKYDKTGGAISGDVSLGANLQVAGISSFSGAVSITNIDTPITFDENITASKAILASGMIATDTMVKVGLNGTNQSLVGFTDLGGSETAFYWDNVAKDFRVNTLGGNGFAVYTTENFDPSTKYDKTGGTITGDVTVTGAISAGTNVDVVGGLTVGTTAGITGALTVGGLSTLADVRTTGNSIVDGTSTFTGDIGAAGNLLLSGMAQIGTGLDVTGQSRFRNDVQVDTNLFVTGAVDVTADIYSAGVIEAELGLVSAANVEVGTDTNNNSSIIFTDSAATNIPVFYWNATNRDFYVDLDTNTAGNEYNIWHGGNFDPSDVTVVPKAFDDLTDTPAAKVAGKYLQVDGTGSTLTYVDVPDVNALWGNITGTMANQTDLIDTLDLKYDKTGGAISGNVDMQGTATIAGTTAVNGVLNINNTATFADAVQVDSTLGVDGVATFNGNTDVYGALVAKSTFQVNGNASLSTDVIVGGDMSVIGTSTLQGNVVTSQDLTVLQNFTAQLSSTFNGVVDMSNLLTVDGAATFNGGVSLIGLGGLTVQADSVFNGDLAVGADLSVTQDAIIQGDLTLSGAGSNLTVTGDTGLNTVTVGGIAQFHGLSYFQQAVDMSANLDVAGNTSTVGVTTTGALDVTTGAMIGTTLDVGGSTVIGSTLDVTGIVTTSADVEIGEDLHVVGVSNLDGTVTTIADVTVGTTLDVGTDITAGGTLTTSGNITTNENLTVDGLSTFTGAATALDDFHVTLNASVGGTTTLTGALTANGGIQATNIAASGTLDVTGDVTTSANLAVTGTSTLNGNVSVAGTLGVTGNTTLTTVDTTDINATGDVAVVGTLTLNGDNVATLDAGGKVHTSQIPTLAISDVYVVADIAARDNLVATPGVQTGDVAKVTDSDGQGNPQTYIYDGSVWIDIQETSNVISVAGHTGVVTLDTADVTENSGFLYYTEARVDANIATKTTDDITEGTNLYFTAARAQAEADTQIASAIGVSVQGYDADTVVDASYVHTDNNYDAAAVAKLAGIEAGATADQTGAEIKTAYEAEADTNVFDDAAVTKLAGIEAGAEVNAVPLGGTTANRPVDPDLYTMYFDTSLVAPRAIWCSDNTNGANVWVDSIGNVV